MARKNEFPKRKQSQSNSYFFQNKGDDKNKGFKKPGFEFVDYRGAYDQQNQQKNNTDWIQKDIAVRLRANSRESDSPNTYDMMESA
ncbi:MAG: hypothetical protein HYZ84_00545 [Candidatus Omnitrophica bacterium]|nr:hypothetical protein [Candidatus Omnitrophota bacterium]